MLCQGVIADFFSWVLLLGGSWLCLSKVFTDVVSGVGNNGYQGVVTDIISRDGC